ncbi:hypothetical protein LPJ73_006013, partial [Coemansia sp. RSA 2703]
MAHPQRAQVPMPYHYHPSTLARTDMRYWPYPQQFNVPLGSPPAGYPYYGHPTLPPPPPIPVSTDPSSTSTTPWRRERRSKACFRCHTKKIKCEGEGPVCDGCRQAGCECKWVEMKKRGPKPKSKPKKNNAEVRADNGNMPDNDAGRVLLLTKTTEAAPAAAVAVDHSTAPASGSGPHHREDNTAGVDNRIGQSLCLSPAVSGMDEVLQRFFSSEVAEDTRDAVISFFDYFYGRIPIFHPASFVRRIVANDVDELLVDTMKAYTARAVMRKTG